MFDFPHPLRLAVGSHAAGSGKGCAMNVVSYENGDTTITDMPACADPLLARIVQRVNDSICTHRDGDLLCPSCSVKVLALAHRTVGTGGLVDLDRRRVWVWVAADQARAVLHLVTSPKALAAIEAAEAWADDPSAENRANAYAAYAAAAVAYGANAAAYAAYDAAATTADSSLALAHRAVDRFYALTGLTEHAPDPERTAVALASMTGARPA